MQWRVHGVDVVENVCLVDLLLRDFQFLLYIYEDLSFFFKTACIPAFRYWFLLAGLTTTPVVQSTHSHSQGKDDLRQDAVMQQVFVLVNRLLKKEPETSKRRLCVRTYKVHFH